jgi:ATP-binding cassette subfamily B protein
MITQVNKLILFSISIEHIRDFLSIDEQDYIKNMSPQIQNAQEIQFESLSFKYPGSQKCIFNNFNVTIAKGEKIAFVGNNGSGKTTLINLILGLYKPTEGQILLNGKNIQNFSKESYFKAFSVVFQDFKLLALTLGENVAASIDYEQNRLKECLNKVGLSSFLEKNSLETYLYREIDKNGTEVSGGEAQKISMSRALYKNSHFFILDEPTAALDPISEFEIYSKFKHMIENKTAIYISHRLSSCQLCDTICVLDKSFIIQRGTHKELIQETGQKYYELWYAQSKHYQ